MVKKIQKNTEGIRLSTALSLLSTSILITATIVGLWMSFENTKTSLEVQTLTLNQYHAQELAHVAGTSIVSMQKSLHEAAEYLIDSDSEPEMIQKNLDFFKASTGFFNSVVIINEQATATYTTPYNLGLAGQKIKSPQTLKQLSLKLPSITAPYTASTGRYLSSISQPLFSKEGKYQGMLAGTIYMKENNRLRQILGTQNQKEDGSYFYVIDNNGNYLYHPNEKLIGENALVNPDFQIFVQGNNGSIKIVGIDEKRYLAGYAYIPETDWNVIFQTPHTNVTDSALQSVVHTSVYLIPAVGLCMVLFFFIANQLSRPLYTLARYTENMGNKTSQYTSLDGKKWNYEANMLKRAILSAEEKNHLNEANLIKEANHDPLTGLLNRRILVKMTTDWIAKNKKIAVIFLDIDHFKSINDTYGHQMGDEALKNLGLILSEQVGPNDYCFRYGGEEFVVLLLNVDEDEAFLTAEQIRKAVQAYQMPFPRQLTISLGIAPLITGDSHQELFEKADLALYQAKKTGRNRTIIYSQMEQGVASN